MALNCFFRGLKRFNDEITCFRFLILTLDFKVYH